MSSSSTGTLPHVDDYLHPRNLMRKLSQGLCDELRHCTCGEAAIHAGLSRCRQGDVLVVDWRGFTGACGPGALTTALAIRRGLVGVVSAGAWRDIADLKRLRFPIMGAGISPFSPGASRLGEVNVPVNCGGVIVCPGDLIVGDYEGAAVVPRAYVELVADSLPPYDELNSADDPIGLPTDERGVSRIASMYWERVARQDARGVQHGGV